jgi:tetratricopeptide (TPR) repeat protein
VVPRTQRSFDMPLLCPISSGWVVGLAGIVDDVFPEPRRPDVELGCSVAVALANQRLGRTNRQVAALDVSEGGAALATVPDNAGSRVLRALFKWGLGEQTEGSVEDCVRGALTGEEPSWAADALLRARLADAKAPEATRDAVAHLPPTSLRRIAALRSAAHWAKPSGDVPGAQSLGAEADELERQADPVRVEARQKLQAAAARWYSGPEVFQVVVFDGPITRATDEAVEVRQLLSDVLSLAARFSTDRDWPVVPCTHVALAWLCWQAHDRETAQSHLESALATLRDDDGFARGTVYAALAQTACMAGDHRAEIVWLRTWAAAEPPFDRPHPLMNLDEALQELGEVDEAARVRAELTELLAALPSRARARGLDRLAASRLGAGDRAGAFELARQALWLATSNEDREESSLATLARGWSLSATLHAVLPSARVVNTAGVVNTSVRPDDCRWALQAWKELQRFEEQRLGGPRTDTLVALADLAWDGGDLHGAAALMLHPDPVGSPNARERRSFAERLVRLAKSALELGQPGLAVRLLNRALERARQDGHAELACDCWKALLAIANRG